ncbi:MAG: tRNA (adenosine(37)-N6)-threonylcarbamoyltransferase complex transferase subunit TsaD [Halanaerobiales bacterium]
MEDKIILGIETSCDETSVAIVKNGRQILSNIVSSQMEIHEKYGGVVPEIASRQHMDYIYIACQEALDKAGINLKDIDGIAVVNGPGLKGSLLVGLSFAKAIAFSLNKPFFGINHIEGHIYANFLNHQEIKTPFISLIVSGGHTSLILVTEMGDYQVLGTTRDDAAGEVFDKIAKYLNLGYPGGPVIEKLALKGKKDAINFPRPLMKAPGFDFSFSGLKTAVIYYVKDLVKMKKPLELENICASFQQAVIDTLVHKTLAAAQKHNIGRVALGGGVAANESLREEFSKKAKMKNVSVYFPSKELCTDNAAMIAVVGYYKLIKGNSDFFDIDVFTG